MGIARRCSALLNALANAFSHYLAQGLCKQKHAAHVVGAGGGETDCSSDRHLTPCTRFGMRRRSVATRLRSTRERSAATAPRLPKPPPRTAPQAGYTKEDLLTRGAGVRLGCSAFLPRSRSHGAASTKRRVLGDVLERGDTRR